MVGAAVAAAVGRFSLGFVAASLEVPARCSLPLAPPHTLVLAANWFMPFPKGANNKVGAGTRIYIWPQPRPGRELDLASDNQVWAGPHCKVAQKPSS